MSKIADIIDRFALASGISQARIGEAIGISQGNISRWKNGKQNPTPENWGALRRFAKGIGYDIPALADIMHPTPSVDILGYVGAGAEVIPLDELDWEAIEVSAPVEDGAKAAIVRGTSMLPVFEDGDLVGFGAHELAPEQVIGRLCIVFTALGKMYIKIVERGSGPGLYNLMSTNSEPMRDLQLQWARPFAFRVARDMWRKD